MSKELDFDTYVIVRDEEEYDRFVEKYKRYYKWEDGQELYDFKPAGFPCMLTILCKGLVLISDTLVFADDLEGPFKPCLRGYAGKNYGHIGEETEMRDVHERILRVGDIVTYETLCFGMTLAFVVRDKGKNYIMGIEEHIKEDGTIRIYSVERVKPYEQLVHGECVNGLKAVLKETD